MARGDKFSGLAQGFALADQSFRAGEAAAVNRAQLDMLREEHSTKMLDKAMKTAANGIYTAMLDKDGIPRKELLTSDRGVAALNAALADERAGPAIAKVLTSGSPAETQGFNRVPVRFEKATRIVGTDEEGRPQFAEDPTKLQLRVQWRDKDGKVVSEGPATANGTNSPDDQVLQFGGDQLQNEMLTVIGSYDPELRKEMQARLDVGRDLSSMKTLAGIQPQSETTVTQAAPKASAVAPAAKPAQTASAAPSAAPTGPAAVDLKAVNPKATDEDAARFTRVRDKAYAEIKTAADELAALKAPSPDANHPGARQAKYQQDVQEKTAEIAKLTAKYKELHERFGVPMDGAPPGAEALAVPSTVPAEQVPQSKTDQPRIQTAAAQTPEQAAPALQSLQTVVKKRGAPKLNDEQKDALAWLAARGKISIEQYDQVLRTGRLAPKIKSAVGDGLGGLYTVDAEGNVNHIEGTYSKLLAMAKGGKGKGTGKDGIELADKQADFLKNHYGFLAMRPGSKGGADVLDSNRFNTVRDNLLVSSASLGFDPYTPQAITMTNKAKQLQDAWVQENGPAWTNLWLKDEKDFNSYTPGIIAAKFGKDMDTVMNEYYAPLRAMMGKDADKVSGQTADGFALVVAGLEARGLPTNVAVEAARTIVQSGRLSAFSSPEQVLAAAEQALAAQ